ncbi:MAG TPA: hypothetical protein VGR33_04955 [Actinomycetota bacterium]|jgi:hypothetical protein|nr:hypothetical protein [Actinomycetota bacterium]
MTEPETKIRTLLNELAGEIRLDPRLERATLKRARRRRIRTAALSLAVVVGLATGGLLAVRGLGPRVTPAGESSPSPSAEPAFAGLWPESDPLSLSAAQAQVDLGHEPWRVDPEQTALAFATNLMGWSFDQVRTNVQETQDAFAIVSVSNRSFGPAVPNMFVALQQLGRTGADGIWSVVRASSTLIRLNEVPTTAVPGSAIALSGRLTDLFDGATLRVDFLDGPTLESAVAGGEIAFEGNRFDDSWPVPSTTDDRLTVLVHVVDATGADLGTDAFPLTIEGVADQQTPPAPALPEAVARTRKVIMDAAARRDFSALQALIDPDQFTSHPGVGDPIVAWKEDPLVLDTFVKLLDMPFAIRPADGSDVYVWPYFTQRDLSTLTPDELELLATIGITQKDVRGMVAFGGYTGPQLGIAADGTWLFYNEGGYS